MAASSPEGLIFENNEFFIICPYNPSHQIMKENFPHHLSHCREAYKKQMQIEGKRVEILGCKYNYTHQLTGPELMSHEICCPNRFDVVPFVSSTRPPDTKKEALTFFARSNRAFHVSIAAEVGSTSHCFRNLSSLATFAVPEPSIQPNDGHQSMGQQATATPSCVAEDAEVLQIGFQLLNVKDGDETMDET